MRIKPRGSAAGHHGQESVIDHVGTREICPPDGSESYPGYKLDALDVEYLLAPIKRTQWKESEELVGRGADAVASIAIAEGVETSMTIFNRRAPRFNY